MVNTRRISVVMPSHLGAGHIAEALESLATQTLPASQFEVIVVLNGPPDATSVVLDEVQRRHPGLVLRVLRSDRAGAGRARNLGLAAAVGEHITFVDDDDWVSPEFLATLLSLVAPGVVPISWIADVQDGEPAPVPDFDNYISTALLPWGGEVVGRRRRGRAIGFNAAKLVPAALARSARYEEHLRSGEDLVYWYDLTATASFDVVVAAPDSGATYYRRVREESVSRQAESYDFAVSHRLDVVAALATRRPVTPQADLELLRTGLLNAQLVPVRAWCDADPSQREVVLADIAARGVKLDNGWTVLNKGLATELAVLYAFVPFVDTSALVAARRIRARGVVVDAISANLDPIRERDSTGLELAGPWIGRRSMVKVKPIVLGWKALKPFLIDGFAVAEEWMAEQSYESLYSRAMLPGSHLLAARIKAAHPDLHWRAEFSDPITWNAYGERRVAEAADDRMYREFARLVRGAGFQPPADRRVAELVETIAFAMADEILFTNPHQLEFMMSKVDDPALVARVRERAVVEAHPTPDAELYHLHQCAYVTDPSVANIAYFGTFYLTRGLTEIIAGLAALSTEERAKVRFHVFTNEPAVLAEELVGTGLEGVIVPNPFVSYLDYLALTTRMDVLLVNDAKTRQHYDLNPYLPSKWSDYRGSGSDVWAIVEDGSVLSQQEMRYRSSLEDVPAAAAVLRQIIGDHADPVDQAGLAATDDFALASTEQDGPVR